MFGPQISVGIDQPGAAGSQVVGLQVNEAQLRADQRLHGARRQANSLRRSSRPCETMRA